MQYPVDKQSRGKQQGSRNPYRNWDIKLFALPVLLVAALISFVVSHPDATKWVAEAVQAEFVGTDFVPQVAPVTRIAEPKSEARTVKAY